MFVFVFIVYIILHDDILMCVFMCDMYVFSHRVYMRLSIIRLVYVVWILHVSIIRHTPTYTMYVPSYSWPVCMCVYIHVYVVRHPVARLVCHIYTRTSCVCTIMPLCGCIVGLIQPVILGLIQPTVAVIVMTMYMYICMNTCTCIHIIV